MKWFLFIFTDRVFKEWNLFDLKAFNYDWELFLRAADFADMHAAPAPFDPLGEVRGDDPIKEGYFIHAGVLECARDVIARLKAALGGGEVAIARLRGIVGDLPLVCVGHSLGAGIACAVAFILRPLLGEVRYVGYEAPGMLSPRPRSDRDRTPDRDPVRPDPGCGSARRRAAVSLTIKTLPLMFH